MANAHGARRAPRILDASRQSIGKRSGVARTCKLGSQPCHSDESVPSLLPHGGPDTPCVQSPESTHAPLPRPGQRRVALLGSSNTGSPLHGLRSGTWAMPEATATSRTV